MWARRARDDGLSACACAAAIVLSAGCGRSSHTVSTVAISASARLEAVCAESKHELLTIDKHTIQPYAQAIGSELEQASHEALAVDTATVRRIRQLPASQNTKVALGDLALSEVELRRIDAIVRYRGTAYSQLPSRLMVAFVAANRGCYRVKVVKPLSG